jgi:hypothetical protein
MPTGFNLAKKCFAENRNLVGEPMSDPQNYNLNEGLLSLVAELETRLNEIDRKLAALLNARR